MNRKNIEVIYEQKGNGRYVPLRLKWGGKEHTVERVLHTCRSVDGEYTGTRYTVLIRGEGDLSPGKFGIPEPPPDFPAADRDGISLAVVPCLAADEDAWRLGRGGGYYDRFLEGFSGDTVLVCPEALVLPRVPREEWDRKCGRLITEDRG